MSPRERLRRWLFRRHGAETGPIDLHRRRIYILPTRTGVLYAIVLIVMYVGAVNYNLGLGHALVFLLVGLGLNGMFNTFRNLADLRIRAGKVQPVFAGETAFFQVLIENLREEIRPGINLQNSGDDAALDRIAIPQVDLGASSLTTIELGVSTKRRGLVALPRSIISTCYPLGLFRAWAYPWPNMHCVVYPAPLFSPLPSVPVTNRTDGRHVLNTEGNDDFSGFRRHQPSDSPQHIAWKIYARNTDDSPLLVKEFSGETSAQLWFEWEQTAPADDIEKRLSILCGWILQAENHGLVFGIRLPELTLAPGRDRQHVLCALEALAMFGNTR